MNSCSESKFIACSSILPLILYEILVFYFDMLPLRRDVSVKHCLKRERKNGSGGCSFSTTSSSDPYRHTGNRIGRCNISDKDLWICFGSGMQYLNAVSWLWIQSNLAYCMNRRAIVHLCLDHFKINYTFQKVAV
jgi:hypothetical protein